MNGPRKPRAHRGPDTAPTPADSMNIAIPATGRSVPLPQAIRDACAG